MTNSEKIKLLRRKFVSATNNLDTIKNAVRAKQPVPLQMVDEVITDVNIMGALFPIQFEDRYGKDEEPVVLINLRDPEGEPDQQTNAGRRILTASFARIIIENIKFDALNLAMVYEPGKEIVEKYKPLLLEQAAWCLTHLLEWPTLGAWEEERLVIYANQLGYYTYTGEQDAGKLQQALEVLQVGYGYSDWRQYG
ncbi:hypothetical protein A4D02_21330 [Niastella koreensis]|uniref:Uncharacterized protein n=2 Tax=Niastella koreensis TaxID=354356 RepID=G8TJ76_NIAKG|nr:hypothetical protein [Niastella koreensis]AEV98609.1 hypothetical protein Niako_2256 [Niastella koreensis GR20-10]OQP52953.1 hypothetical protein A4D02_21330 [Niastella koreensis]